MFVDCQKRGFESFTISKEFILFLFMSTYNHYAIDRPNFKLVIKNQRTVVHKEFNRVITTVDWELVSPQPYNNLRDGFNVPVGWENMSGTCKGVAICKEDDVFDIEKGTKISIAIAESNAYRNATNRMRKFNAHVANVFKQIDAMTDKFAFKAMDIIKHNKEYISNVSE